MNDKLVRLSDVIEMVENQCSDGNMWGNENLTLIDASKTIDELSEIPAVDAVEVVRCGQCRFTKTDSMDDPAIYCERWDRWEMPPDGYCAWGQRREDCDA